MQGVPKKQWQAKKSPIKWEFTGAREGAQNFRQQGGAHGQRYATADDGYLMWIILLHTLGLGQAIII